MKCGDANTQPIRRAGLTSSRKTAPARDEGAKWGVCGNWPAQKEPRPETRLTNRRSNAISLVCENYRAAELVIEPCRQDVEILRDEIRLAARQRR